MEVIPDCTTTTSVKCSVLRIERVYSDRKQLVVEMFVFGFNNMKAVSDA